MRETTFKELDLLSVKVGEEITIDGKHHLAKEIYQDIQDGTKIHTVVFERENGLIYYRKINYIDRLKTLKH
jgi:hypothetical protein